MSFNFNLISRHNPSLCNSLQEELMNMLPNFPLMTCQEFADTIDIYLGQRRGNDDLFGPMAEELTNGFGRLQCVHGSAAINMLASPPLYLLEESSSKVSNKIRPLSCWRAHGLLQPRPQHWPLQVSFAYWWLRVYSVRIIK